MTDAAIRALIVQGVADSLARRPSKETLTLIMMGVKVLEVVKGTDLASYTQHFQELALMYGRMFLKELKVVEKNVGGLPDMIQGNVMSTKPKTMEEA
nr:reverse transcriptase domain-containing protein [Tanacetum cinerariifolium]